MAAVDPTILDLLNRVAKLEARVESLEGDQVDDDEGDESSSTDQGENQLAEFFGADFVGDVKTWLKSGGAQTIREAFAKRASLPKG